MPDGNPLVAAAQTDTTAVTGIGIAESSVDLANGISNGDWVEAGLGAVGVGLEVLSMVIDPIGTIASYGVSWLIEHVQPLKEALDWFAGDPPVIRSFSETWGNVAAEVGKIAADYTNEIKAGTAGWTGQSADTYRGKGTETADAVAGAGALADGISAGVMIMGEVVAAVREIVRDLVAEVVGKLITWALEAVATLGLGTPVIVAQATAAISKVVNKIADLVRKLVKTIGNVTPRIRKIISKLDEIIAKLGKLGRKGDAPGSTSPSSATTPDGLKSTSPSGTTSPAGTTSPDTTTSPSGDTTSPSSSSPDTSTPNSSSGTSTSGTKAKDGADDPRRSGQDEKSTCTNGDPINMFTGEMLLPQTDVDLAGVLPLQLNRKHLSGYRAGRLFGPTWASTLDQRVEVEPDGVYYVAEDGRILVYPIPAADGTAVMPVEGARWPLRRDGDHYTITQPETWTTLSFDVNSGAITSVAGRTGHRIDFSYGAEGALTGLTHSGGYRIGVDTVDGLVTRIFLRNTAAPDNVLMRYGYEGRRLTTVTNSSNRSHRFDYDQAGRIIHWEDRNSEWYRFHYDADGRCVRTEGSGDALTGTLDIDHGNRVSVWTNSLGHRTTYYFNELNQVAREVDSLGNATLSEWDRYDRLLSHTDPLGNVTRYEYDARGNLVTLIRADGTQRLHVYDDENRLLTTVDPNGAVWRREYDTAGNLVATTDPVGATTRYMYDARAHISAVTDPLGSVHLVETNPAGLPTATTDPLGAVTRFQRDQFGRVTSIIDPLGNVTQYRWTIEGALLSRTLPDGTTEVWRYDGEGNHVEHVDALGQVTRTLTTHFDMPSTVTTPDGGTVSYQYDSELRLTTVINQLGQIWRYVYDATGNLVSETDFTGRTLTYEYDAAGRVVTRTNALGEQTHLTWDRVGNLVERRSAEGSARFEFDEAGRLRRATNADADVVYQRDAAGRVLTETVNGRTVASTYDKLGRLTSRRTPSGAESGWAYDAAGRPAALHTSGRTLTFSHDAAGREMERIFDGGLTISQTWNGNRQLTGQTVLAGAPARFVQQRRYQYRPDDYVTSIEDHLAGTSQFELDAVGRVVSAQSPAGIERYTYDLAGNTEPRDGGVYRYDQQGRLVMRQRKRLSDKPATWRYNWDSEDRLVEVITPDGTHWRYRYDALGRRISKERLDGSGERTDFVWDGDLLAEQVHSSGHTMSWDYAPDAIRPLTQIERSQESIDQQFYGIVTDLIGTPMELVSMAGDIAWRSRQSVWGASSDGATPLRFPGQYYDAETGLHYNHHRYYVPELAGYASVDPLGLLPSPNPRAYVPNPMSWLDPLGLAACRDCNARQQDLPKGDNRWFGSRREAFNAARDRIGIPRSQQPVRQWTVGGDPSMQGRANYHYDPAPGSHGRYYQYDTPNGPRVIAEHNADPRAPHPHFHAYQPKDGANGIVIGDKYARVDGPHHYYHSGHEPNWTP